VLYLDQLPSVVRVEGYHVDQGVRAGTQSPNQFAGLFAVEGDDLCTALDKFA
jgi:hypothetical protein